MDQKKKQEVYLEFNEKVNMSPSELEEWLVTEKSNNVGQDSGNGESIGHKSGKRIVGIKRKNKADLTEADYEHMQKVSNYLARHLGQRPDGDVKETNWRYSLQNWGHDPVKK